MGKRTKEIRIYKHENKINGKIYIGQTTQSLADRSGHDGKGYYHCQKVFAKEIEEYGWDNFTHEIIEEVDNRELANERERYWIDFYDSTNPDKGYNRETGGLSGCKVSKEVCEERSQRYMGKGNPRYGKHCNEETKKKIGDSHRIKYLGEGNPMYGKTHTEKVRERLRQFNLEHNHEFHYIKSVYCITTNILFPSIKSAKKYYNTAPHIGEVCTGKRQYCGKYKGEQLKWKYEADMTEEEMYNCIKYEDINKGE